MAARRRTTRPRRAPRQTHADPLAVVADYRNGLQIAEIIDRHDIGLTTLYRILREHGVPKRQDHERPSPTQVADEPAVEPRGRRKTRLVDVDDEQLAADYQSGEPIAALTERHGIGLTRLYQILDRHQVPRRSPKQPRIPGQTRRLIVNDYSAGQAVDEIAANRRVSPSTVAAIAERAGLTRQRRRSRTDLVTLTATWLLGGELGSDDREAIARIGCRLTTPGLGAIDTIEPTLRADVIRHLIIELTRRLADRPAVPNVKP